MLLLAAVPVACTVPYWTNHAFSPIVGPVMTAAPRTIAILPVHLPQYLMRTEIVRSSDTSQPEILPWDWWADALWILIGRTTVQNLTQRLPGSIVYADTGAVTAQPGASVEMTIERFDTTLSGSVQLQARKTGRCVGCRACLRNECVTWPDGGPSGRGAVGKRADEWQPWLAVSSSGHRPASGWLSPAGSDRR
jgi:hypothetical protein